MMSRSGPAPAQCEDTRPAVVRAEACSSKCFCFNSWHPRWQALNSSTACLQHIYSQKGYKTRHDHMIPTECCQQSVAGGMRPHDVAAALVEVRNGHHGSKNQESIFSTRRFASAQCRAAAEKHRYRLLGDPAAGKNTDWSHWLVL